MADLKEVFDMVTKQSEPDLDSWREQEGRQRRRMRNRKAGALAVVAAIVATLAALALTRLPGRGNSLPAHRPTSKPTTSTAAHNPPFGAQIIGLDGSVVEQVPASLAGAESLVLSPDGTRLAYSLAGAIHVVKIDGQDDRTLTDGLNRTAGDAKMHISWSPDGSKLAYVWDDEIYVMNADGSGKLQLTHSLPGKGSYYPAFSPDGTTIAYWSGRNTGEDGGPPGAQIYTIPASGGHPTQLTYLERDWHAIEPAWSPDGRLIAFMGGEQLWTVRADGSRAHPVSDAPWAPAWSPDGTKIASLVFDPTDRAVDGGPLLKVQILTVATGTVQTLPVRVESDHNGPQWASNSTLLINRYD
jgi:Tol biopolymer transport system component